MMEQKIDPLPPSEAALLGVLRRPDDVPADVRAALFARVTATLAGGPPPGGGGTPGAARGPTGPPVTPARPLAWAARPLSTAIAGFALGGVVGAFVHAELAPSAPLMPAVHGIARLASARTGAPAVSPYAPGDATPPPQTVAAPTRPAELPAAAPSVLPRPPPTTAPTIDTKLEAAAPPQPSATAAPDAALARERALVQMARTALTQGQSGRALEALQRHAAESPDGRLREDREALEVQVLASAGRAREARAALDRFRSRFPSSVFLPAAERAVAAAKDPAP